MCFYSLFFFYIIFYCFQINFTHSSYSFATEQKYFLNAIEVGILGHKRLFEKCA